MGEVDFQSGKFAVVNGMRLCREDFFQFVLRDASREGLASDRNMLRNIRDHFDTLVNVVIKKIGAQLRI